jgi:hypothetical protein
VAKSIPDAELLPYLQSPAEPDMGLAKRIPGAVFARVVPGNIDPAAANGLGYAHQDMVLRLAAGKRVTPEISFYENGAVKEQVLTYARLLKGADGNTAVALISFPFREVASALKDFAPDAGRVELIQKSGSERATIISNGDGVEVPGADVATANPGWELRFSPSAALGHGDGEGAMMLGLGVFVALAVGGLLVWILLSLQRAVNLDIAAVDSFSENYFRYGNRQRPLLGLSSFSLLMAHLDQYGSELRAGKGVGKPPTDNLGTLDMVKNDAALLGDAPEPKAVKPAQKNPDASAAAGVRRDFPCLRCAWCRW